MDLVSHEMEGRPGFCRAGAISARSAESQAPLPASINQVKAYPHPEFLLIPLCSMSK